MGRVISVRIPFCLIDVLFVMTSCYVQAHDQHGHGDMYSRENNIDFGTDIDRCSNLSRHHRGMEMETQTWQAVTDRDVMIFSAFVERRDAADGPAIRILGSGLQNAYNDIGDLYCLLWDSVSPTQGPVSVKAKYVRIYPSTLHHDMWVGHFVLCPLQDLNDIPETVSVTSNPCALPSTLVKVLGRFPTTKTDTHALCLPSIHNKYSDWESIVEMFEIQRMMGVIEITVYNQSLGTPVDAILKYYERNPENITVNVIQWHFPNRKSSYFLQRGAINECFYRVGSRHRYVTISDLDEILVPRGASRTLLELMRVIATPERGAYLFQHAYFRRNDTGERPYLITQQSLWRTDEVTPPGKIRCKSMYNSDKGVSIDIHFPYQLTPGAEEYILEPEVGMLHHYRKTPMTNFVRNPQDYRYIEDTHMTEFADRLKEAVLIVHKKSRLT